MSEEKQNPPRITVGQLVEILQKLDQNATVYFPIIQDNRAFPVEYLHLEDGGRWSDGIPFWVSRMIPNQVRITLRLPDNHGITKRKEK